MMESGIPPAGTERPTVGALLRLTRTQRGLTVPQVAAGTKLPERFVLALEADDFTALPGGSYPAIYLKSYARFLELDPATLLKHYHAQLVPVPDQPVSVGRADWRALLADYRVLGGALFALVLFLLVVAVQRGERGAAPGPDALTLAAGGDTTALAADTAPAPAPLPPALAAAAARVDAILAGGGKAAARAALAREMQQQADRATDAVLAAGYCRQVARLNPRYPLTEVLARLAKKDYERGAALFTDGKFAAAVTALRRAIAIDASDAYQHYLLARALDSLDQRAEAEREYRAAVAINRPAFARYHYWLAALLAKKGDRPGARAALAAYRAAGGDQRADLEARVAELTAQLAD